MYILKNMYQNKHPIQFIITCSRTDILQVVEQRLSVNGILPVVGMQGELVFVIDGRWGGQLAAKRILNLKDSILDTGSDAESARAALTEAMIVVDKVLERYVFRQHLQGYVILRHALTYIYLHDTIPTPLTKTIFCDIAEIMKLSCQQVERNLRYLFEKLSEDESILKLQFPAGKLKTSYFGPRHRDKVVRLLIDEDKPYSIRVCLTRLGTLILQAKKEFLKQQKELAQNPETAQEEIKPLKETLPAVDELQVAETITDFKPDADAPFSNNSVSDDLSFDTASHTKDEPSDNVVYPDPTVTPV